MFNSLQSLRASRSNPCHEGFLKPVVIPVDPLALARDACGGLLRHAVPRNDSVAIEVCASEVNLRVN